ncbi:hypothetical protein AB1M95_01130 [Sulfitobacter sp. LCG007]
MAQLEVTPSGLRKGVWHARVRGSGRAEPALSVLLRGETVPQTTLSPTQTPGEWLLKVPVPPGALDDGLQTVVVCDDMTGETLASLAILAGAALGDDLRAEVDLLRAEMEMLKRAFRRHCSEGR